MIHHFIIQFLIHGFIITPILYAYKKTRHYKKAKPAFNECLGLKIATPSILVGFGGAPVAALLNLDWGIAIIELATMGAGVGFVIYFFELFSGKFRKYE